MRQLDWAGCLDEEQARWVLLVDPAATPLTPLVERLLLKREPHTEAMWQASGWDQLRLAQALGIDPAARAQEAASRSE